MIAVIACCAVMSGCKQEPVDTTVLDEWQAGQTVSNAAVTAYGGLNVCFSADPIPDRVWQRMQGKTYIENPYIGRDDLRHVRAYRLWCERNFSTMDNIDVQWIVRYLVMLLVLGLSLFYMCLTDNPDRAFTQQWLLLLLFGYSTVQILFRPDPWKQLHSTVVEEEKEEEKEKEPDPANAAYRATLEEWLEKEKPYLNPEFQLMDLRQVLPLNRSYLSQLINSEYGCTFYQWINGLRIEEAKRLMTEQPDLKIQDVAERCGFSNQKVLWRTFVNETGMSPSEWKAKFPNT